MVQIRLYPHVLLCGMFLAILLVLVVRSELPAEPDSLPGAKPLNPSIEKGRYLATIGNCVTCHTKSDGPPFGGGVAFHVAGGLFKQSTGIIYSTNITPDLKTGIGGWTEEEFSRAMRTGVSAGGDHLYPVFPYMSFSRINEEDMAAIYAYIMSMEPIEYNPPASNLPFPFNMRLILRFWKLLFADNEVYQSDRGRSDEWNRGAYLTQGLGHCSACHSPRTYFLAEQSDHALSGGTHFDEVEEGKIREWAAVNLTSADTGLGSWSEADIANYLQTGHNVKAGTFGPMNKVIVNSTQYLTADDAKAMAVYLKSLLPIERNTEQRISEEEQALGLAVYNEHCEECHLGSGRGAFLKAPPVSGSAIVQAPDSWSLINVILYGASVPAEAPTPFGAWEDMGTYKEKLNDEEIAALSNYLRTAWGNKGGRVTVEEVARQR